MRAAANERYAVPETGEILGTRDRTITPAAQRFMAERAGATIEEVKASHLSLISLPGAVTGLIEQAARVSRPLRRALAGGGQRP